MHSSKRVFLFLTFSVVIFFPNSGKCDPINSKISSVPEAVLKEDEGTICFNKLAKGQIPCTNLRECIENLREKNGAGTFISMEKAFQDYMDRSNVEISRTSQKIAELSNQLKGINSSCPVPIWMPAANGEFPLGALSIDKDAKVFVARAYLREQVYLPGPKFSTKLMPGKVEIGHPQAYVQAYPHELSIYEYEVLVIPSEAVEWAPFNNSVPQNAIIGGYEEHLDREDIYIGRFKTEGTSYRNSYSGVGPILMEEENYNLITTYSHTAFKHDKFEILVLKEDPNCNLLH